MSVHSMLYRHASLIDRISAPGEREHDGTSQPAQNSKYAIDLIIMRILQSDNSAQPRTSDDDGDLRLHQFSIDEKVDAICYTSPITGTYRCSERLRIRRDDLAQMDARTSTETQRVLDLLISLRMFEPTATFSMLLIDDCSICKQTMNSGRLSGIINFMREFDARFVVAGSGLCGQIFRSADVIKDIPSYLENHILEHITDAGDHLKRWGRSTGSQYTFKHNIIHFDRNTVMAYDGLLSRCGELSPYYDADRCWDTPFSPCESNNSLWIDSEYAGHNPYHLDINSLQYVYGKTAKRSITTNKDDAVAYNFMDLMMIAPFDMLVARLPDSRTFVLASARQDCNTVCKHVGKRCDGIFDSTLLNDCSFLNSVFNLQPPVKCIIELNDPSPIFINSTFLLSPRHMHVQCKRPFTQTVGRYVCPCV